ncbi:MAG: hypothetical protein RJB38_843 [Pseudomonadota bacterium]|jgi:hypothetical protein
MLGPFPQSWYLELHGKRMGPFPPEQVLGLLADGEIPGNMEVFAVHADGHRDERFPQMTVLELKEHYFRDDRIPHASTLLHGDEALPFHAPADASLPVAHDESASEAFARLATARRLFELFQAAKDRRAKFFPPAPQISTSTEFGSTLSPAKIRKLIAAGTAAVIVAAAGTQGFKQWQARSKDEQPQRAIAQTKPSMEAEPRASQPVRQAPAVPRFAPKAFQRPVVARTPPQPPTPERPREDVNWANQAAINRGEAPNSEPYQPPANSLSPEPMMVNHQPYDPTQPPPGMAGAPPPIMADPASESPPPYNDAPPPSDPPPVE